jgi:hypothetical protein
LISAQAFVRVREGFRQNAQEVDQEKIATALKAANSSIGYVKMMTPKHLQKKASDGPSDGVTRIVIGDKANNGRNPTSNWTGTSQYEYGVLHDALVTTLRFSVLVLFLQLWTLCAVCLTLHDKLDVLIILGSNMDPDSVRRHKRSLQRAGFTSNRHAKGPAF